MTNMVFRERILINSMFSVVPNIVFAPNMPQNAERKHRTQDTNTANFRSFCAVLYHPHSDPFFQFVVFDPFFCELNFLAELSN